MVFNKALNVLLWFFFIASSGVLFVGALAIWFVTSPLDPNRRVLQQYSCFWASLYIWVNPFWSVAAIKGLEHVDRHKAYVMVANHQSMVDILVLYRTFLHFKWVSKASLFKAPFVGWNMWLNGYVPINRGDAESREACLSHCRDWLVKGSSVLFFPEGTRSPDGVMRPFKPGAFRLALETGCSILPIIIRGSADALPKHSVFLTRKSRMWIEIFPEIAVTKGSQETVATAAQALADKVYRQMKEAFEKGVV